MHKYRTYRFNCCYITGKRGTITVSDLYSVPVVEICNVKKISATHKKNINGHNISFVDLDEGNVAWEQRANAMYTRIVFLVAS
jgi:hypothetical protein